VKRLLTTLVAGALLAGCGVPSQDHPTRLDDDHVRISAPTTTTSVPGSVPTQRVQLCLIGDDRLVAFDTDVVAPVSVADVLDALIEVSRSTLPPGTRSGLDDADLVTARATEHGVAHIDLTARFLETLPADQILAVAEIVCTVTGLPGIGQVRFTKQGQPVDVPRADSSLTDRPVSRDDYIPLLPVPASPFG